MVKVEAKVLCRFEKITALEVVIEAFLQLVWGRCRGAWLTSSIRQRVLIVVRGALSNFGRGVLSNFGRGVLSNFGRGELSNFGRGVLSNYR